MIEILKSIEVFQNWKAKQTVEVVTVFTMGALHPGHLELINSAKKYIDQDLNGNGKVVVSIFINPLQFNNEEDLDNYPRTFEDDLKLCEIAGVDAVFAPTSKDMYPNGKSQITIDHGTLGNDLEGDSRPGHFVGMLTVVNKLLNITKPVATFFGEKDFQQLALVKKMVTELNIQVEVIGVPTVRDLDGLALSSRNSRLTPEDRKLATQIPAALNLIKHSIDEGHSLESARKLALEYLNNFPKLKLDYLELRNNELEIPKHNDSVRALIAMQIDQIRLIDNMTVRD